MKLRSRKTPPRSPSKKRKKVKYTVPDTVDKGRDDSSDDMEEDVTFEEITPFSPLGVASQTPEKESEEEGLSSAEDVSIKDKESTAPFKKLTRSMTAKKGCTGKTSRKGKSQKRSGAKGSQDFEDEIELVLVIEDNKIGHVQSILQQLPDHFSKEYCKYLYALLNQNNSISNKKVKTSKSLLSYCSPIDAPSNNKCVICDEVLKPEETREHLEEHGGPDGFKCVCDKTFNTIKSFYGHFLRSHSGPIRLCPYCHSSCYGTAHLKVHLKKIHSKCYICTICQKGFKKEWMLLEHINVHTGLYPHKCNHCEKAYMLSESLKEHIKIIHKNVEFKCTVCEKTFTCQRYLRIHGLVHGEDRKYKCTTCGKAFKTAQNLNRHCIFHVSTKCFVCDDCGSSFATRTDLNRHCLTKKHGRLVGEKTDGPSKSISKSDKTEKRFGCKFCASSFKIKSSLNKHVRKKHENPLEEHADGERGSGPDKSESNGFAALDSLEERADSEGDSDPDKSESNGFAALDSLEERADSEGDSDPDTIQSNGFAALDSLEERADSEGDSDPDTIQSNIFAALDPLELALNHQPLQLDKPLFISMDIENDSDDESEEKEFSVL